MDADAIIDLFDAAISEEDEGQARILRSMAMGEMELQLRAGGGCGDMDFFDLLFTTLLERPQQRKSE